MYPQMSGDRPGCKMQYSTKPIIFIVCLLISISVTRSLAAEPDFDYEVLSQTNIAMSLGINYLMRLVTVVGPATVATVMELRHQRTNHRLSQM